MPFKGNGADLWRGKVHRRLQAMVTICKVHISEVVYLWMPDAREREKHTGIPLSLCAQKAHFFDSSHGPL